MANSKRFVKYWYALNNSVATLFTSRQSDKAKVLFIHLYLFIYLFILFFFWGGGGGGGGGIGTEGPRYTVVFVLTAPLQ